MSKRLTGTVSGATRSELITRARTIASDYFEVPGHQIEVHLSDETVEQTSVRTTANQIATVSAIYSADFLVYPVAGGAPQGDAGA